MSLPGSVFIWPGNMDDLALSAGNREPLLLFGGRCALGPHSSPCASIEIDGGRVTQLLGDASSVLAVRPGCATVDLNGYLVMPGLVSAHDHLQFALFPKLAFRVR